MKRRNMTTSQKIHFAKASNCIESEFALHCYYHSTEVRPDSPYSSVLWSKQHDKISSAHGFGGLIGWDNCVGKWSQGMEDMGHMMYDKIQERYPEVRALVEKSPDDYYYIGGGCVMHAIVSPIIEVSEDGMSTKASFYTPGILFSNISPDGNQGGALMWERYGQDWVFEDDEWRIIHNQVMLDFNTSLDTDNAGRDTYRDMTSSGWIWNTMMPGPPGGMTIPGPANMDYWPVQTVQRTVMWPEPFKTYDDTWHYIPEPGDGVGRYRIPDLPDNGMPYEGLLEDGPPH